MTKIKNIIYLITFLLFVSCAQNKRRESFEKLLNIDIDIEHKDRSYDLSNDIESEFDIIPLETNDNCLIGRVSKIISENNLYYVLDKLSKRIYIFNNKGKFVAVLNRCGVGPNEYVNIDNFIVISKDIWIYDNTSSRIICYDERLNAKDVIKLNNFQVTDFVFKDNNIYMVNNFNSTINSTTYEICIYDIVKKEIKYQVSLPKAESSMVHWRMPQQLTNTKKPILFIPNYFTDTIFTFKENKAIPQYKLKFSDPQKITAQKGKPNSDIIIINSLYQTEKSIIIEYL
jgi:hypothetical protein